MEKIRRRKDSELYAYLDIRVIMSKLDEIVSWINKYEKGGKK